MPSVSMGCVQSSICDIIPTILEAFDMQTSSSTTGRALSEVLARRAAGAPLLASVTQIAEIRSGNQRAQRTQVGSTLCLGWNQAVGLSMVKTTEVA